MGRASLTSLTLLYSLKSTVGVILLTRMDGIRIRKTTTHYGCMPLFFFGFVLDPILAQIAIPVKGKWKTRFG